MRVVPEIIWEEERQRHKRSRIFIKNAASQKGLPQRGAGVLTGLNEKHGKIKGFRQSINGINLKIKYFSFIKYASIIKSELFFALIQID